MKGVVRQVMVARRRGMAAWRGMADQARRVRRVALRVVHMRWASALRKWQVTVREMVAVQDVMRRVGGRLLHSTKARAWWTWDAVVVQCRAVKVTAGIA